MEDIMPNRNDQYDDVAIATKRTKVEEAEEHDDELGDSCSIDFHQEAEDDDEQEQEAVLQEEAKPQATVATTTGPQTTTSISPSTKTIKYAPKIEPVKFDGNLYGIAVQWSDAPGFSLGEVKGAVEAAAKNITKISRGNVNFNVIAKNEKVKYTKDRANLGKAEAAAKSSAIAGQKNKLPSIFVIYNNVSNRSHSSGATAHLIQRAVTITNHEIFHLKPFELQHSNMPGKNGGSMDGTCVMSIKSCLQLTFGQTYARGWMPVEKAGLYDTVDFEPVEFEIERLDLPDTAKALKGVKIPRKDASGKELDPLFLSMPKVPTGSKNGEYKLALHTLYKNSGTIRQAVFNDKASFEDLSFETVTKTDQSWKVRLSRNRVTA